MLDSITLLLQWTAPERGSDPRSEPYHATEDTLTVDFSDGPTSFGSLGLVS